MNDVAKVRCRHHYVAVLGRGHWREEIRWSSRAARWVALLWVVTLPVTVLFLAKFRWNHLIIPSLIEATIIAATLLALLSFREIRGILGGLSRGKRGLLFLLAVASVWAQEFKLRPLTFPFVDWRMYSDRVNPEQLLLQFEGVGSSGQRRSLALAEMVPSLDEWRLYGHLHDLHLRARRQPETPQGQAAAELFWRALRAAALRYNARQPLDPLVGVEVFRVDFDVREFRDGVALKRAFVGRLDLQGAS